MLFLWDKNGFKRDTTCNGKSEMCHVRCTIVIPELFVIITFLDFHTWLVLAWTCWYEFTEKFMKTIKCRSSRPEVVCKKSVLRNIAKFTGKHLCQSLFFNKVPAFRRLWHRCFPVNFAKLLRTPILTEHLRWLLLKMKTSELMFGSG